MNRSVDLALAITFALASTLLVLLVPPVEPVRIGIGLAFGLFLPGYFVVAALYPRKDDLDHVERLALSVGLSIAVVTLIGLGLNYSPWGIRLNPILIFVTLFIVIAAGVAMYRRATLPSEVAAGISLNLGLPRWPRVHVIERFLALLLVMTLAGLGVGSYFLATSSTDSKQFTEFYVLGPDGNAEAYPRVVEAGQVFMLTLVVANHEGEEASYRVLTTVGGRLALNLVSHRLANGEKWEMPLLLMAMPEGSNQKVQFVLYKGDSGVPYRTLHLWLDIEG